MQLGNANAGLQAIDNEEEQMFEYLMRYKQNFPERKFYQLIDKVYNRRNLVDAWEKVKANKGCAGIDKQSIHEFWIQKEQKFAEIERQLRNRSYTPMPMLRRNIPKGNGKLRPLGIPTVKDRIVQQATKNVIEQIFEAEFMDVSYGFRPNKNAHEAIEQIIKYLQEGFTWIIDADIKGFFDNVDHDILMKLISERISDGKVLNLIEGWLKSGVMTQGIVEETEQGTPQGGVISPLLANVYLSEMDKEITMIANVRLIRYADDFVIMCKTKWMTTQVMTRLKHILGKLKLSLSEEKTRVLDANKESFEFLGFVFRFDKRVVLLKPREKSLNKFKDSVRTITNKEKSINPKEMIGMLNRTIRGWGNYFKIMHGRNLFLELDIWIRMRCRMFIEKRKSRYSHIRIPNNVLKAEYKLASLITLKNPRSL